MNKASTHYSRRNFLKHSASSTLLTTNLTTIGTAFSQNNQLKNKPITPELYVPHWIDGNGKETTPFTLAQHENKWIFLKCFQNWCPGCHSSGFPALRKIVKTFGTDHEKIAFAAIQTTFEGYYTNNKAALRPLQLRYETPIPFGHDAGNPSLPKTNPKHYPNTMRDFNTRGTPWIIIISPDRHIVFENFHIKIDLLIDHLKTEFAKT